MPVFPVVGWALCLCHEYCADTEAQPPRAPTGKGNVQTDKFAQSGAVRIKPQRHTRQYMNRRSPAHTHHRTARMARIKPWNHSELSAWGCAGAASTSLCRQSQRARCGTRFLPSYPLRHRLSPLIMSVIGLRLLVECNQKIGLTGAIVMAQFPSCVVVA